MFSYRVLANYLPEADDLNFDEILNPSTGKIEVIRFYIGLLPLFN
jgi:hypothetical protein